MTFLLWAGFGIALASAMLHGAIGLRRPLAWSHVSFGAMAIFLCGYLVGQKQEFAASLPSALVAIERRQFILSAGLVATLAWFTREYTGVRVRRWVAALFYATVALFVLADLIAPYGGFLGSMPQLATAKTIGGERVTVFSSSLGALQIAWVVLVASFLVIAMWMGIRLVRRGERRRGGVFAAALALMVAFPLIDLLRGSPGQPHAHVGALGVVGLALIMSIDLAVDFRAKEDQLERAFAELESRARKIASMLESSIALRDQLNTPLQTLELDFTMMLRAAPQPPGRVARLRHALDRLNELSLRLQRSAGETGGPQEAGRLQ